MQIVSVRAEIRADRPRDQTVGVRRPLPAGVVITGGTASLPGLRDLAARALALPVRVGLPRRLHGLVETISSPAYATSVGLLLWGWGQQSTTVEIGHRATAGGEWYERVRRWLRVFLPG